MIPWRFGTAVGESSCSYLWVRIQAFISRAVFTSPVQVLAVGDPVVGYVEPSSGTSKSAQLSIWSPAAVDNSVFCPLVITF